MVKSRGIKYASIVIQHIYYKTMISHRIRYSQLNLFWVKDDDDEDSNDNESAGEMYPLFRSILSFHPSQNSVAKFIFGT